VRLPTKLHSVDALAVKTTARAGPNTTRERFAKRSRLREWTGEPIG